MIAVVDAVEHRAPAVPLSYQQAMYWQAEQQGRVGFRVLAEDRHVANAFGAIRMQGLLQMEILQRALDEVLRRHESLRTRFVAIDGQMMQIATGAATVPIEEAELSQQSPDDREQVAALLAAQAALGRFDYGSGVLLRAHVIRLSSRDAIVVVTVPHLVSDAASIQVLINELLTLYAHLLHGRASPLPEPPVQYADYVLWQQSWVRGLMADRVAEYVEGHFVGARPLPLPVDEARDQRPWPADAAEQRFALDGSLLARVQAASVRQRVTPFVMMLAAFTVLLSRWTGRTDVLLLAPFAARPDARTQKTIGMFSNLCPLRADLSGDPLCADVVEQLQEHVLRAMQFRSVQYAVLVEQLRGRGDLSCDGVGVNAVPDGGEVMPRGCAELFGSMLRVTPYVVDPTTIARRQMRGYLSCWTGFTAGGGITGRLMYPLALFDADTIARVARRLLDVIDRLTQHPQRRLSTLTD